MTTPLTSAPLTWLITFGCGHLEPRDLAYLPAHVRAAAAHRMTRGSCSHCLRIRRSQRRKARRALQEQKRREAERWSNAMHLPALVGTQRQIAWAVRVRRRLLTAAKPAPDLAPNLVDDIVDRARTITSAAWWLDHRDLNPEAFARLPGPARRETARRGTARGAGDPA